MFSLTSIREDIPLQWHSFSNGFDTTRQILPIAVLLLPGPHDPEPRKYGRVSLSEPVQSRLYPSWGCPRIRNKNRFVNTGSSASTYKMLVGGRFDEPLNKPLALSNMLIRWCPLCGTRSRCYLQHQLRSNPSVYRAVAMLRDIFLSIHPCVQSLTRSLRREAGARSVCGADRQPR